MNKKYLLILLLLAVNILFACDCEKQKIALEFYNSEFVFKGKVTQKEYNNNLSTYTITVNVIKHYKRKKNLPNEFKFTFPSEHNKIKTSCDFFINKNETLLLYVKLNKENLTFSLMCSNSKRINNTEISKKELAILNKGNEFNITNYILEYEQGFNYSIHKTNIDSIISLHSNYFIEKNMFSVIVVDIDEKGKLITSNLYDNSSNVKYKVVDTIFNLNHIINKEYRKPKNNFEKVILEISKQIKNWTSYKNIKTGQAIRHRKYLKFQTDFNGNLTYEY